MAEHMGHGIAFKQLKLDMITSQDKTRGSFLSNVTLEHINVSEHHAPNAFFCLFLAWLLQRLRMFIWHDIPTSEDFHVEEQKDIALFKELLPKFREVRAELNKKFSPKDWFDKELREEIRDHINDTVTATIAQIKAARRSRK